MTEKHPVAQQINQRLAMLIADIRAEFGADEISVSAMVAALLAKRLAAVSVDQSAALYHAIGAEIDAGFANPEATADRMNAVSAIFALHRLRAEMTEAA